MYNLYTQGVRLLCTACTLRESGCYVRPVRSMSRVVMFPTCNYDCATCTRYESGMDLLKKKRMKYTHANRHLIRILY